MQNTPPLNKKCNQHANDLQSDRFQGCVLWLLQVFKPMQDRTIIYMQNLSMDIDTK